MTLTFHEIGLRFPDAVVLWDRDVAPALDWEPRFVELQSEFIGALSARHPDCVYSHYEATCRCLVWDEIDSEWVSREAMRQRGFEREAWRDVVHFTDEAYARRGKDMADAIPYAAKHMWRTGHSARDEYREIERGRWPTLRRVLGRNVPR